MSDPCNPAKSIFLAAIEEHTPEQWPSFLDKACAGDLRLRGEVEKLLRARSEMGTFHEPPRPAALATALVPEIGERPGTIIGPYKLLEQIGEGGFGLVFMAEQQQPVRRKVALKILKPGMDTRQVIARFEAERQALALMDHPNIARVLDAGETSSGRPHFVMELVKGVPITDYCDQNRLTTRERLALFTHVCHAVQHAHHKGIIHRDLKPSNVMVTLHDGVPVVKVIDFGIAKALGQQLTDKTLFTGFAQMVGTPLYMSPEQAQLSGLDIDTRSDIYSLGVLLYELLAGVTPFDKERLRTAGYDEMRRIIREEDPPSPSTRLSTLGETAVTVSAQRQSDPRRLSRLLRGELDWIVMKALDKDRNRRYETANELARDVDRYLHDEPVLACPPSSWYRFRKFMRRKKSTVVVAAGVFLALAGIAGGIGWGLRDRAGREEALDQAVDRTLKETGPLFEQENWHEALGAVERADQLLAAAGRTKRPPRLLELRTELSMAERLERIHQRPKLELPVLTSSEAGTGPTIQERRASSEQDFFFGRQADAEYALAFRDFGIDLDALEPAEAAEQIARCGIFPALVKALDQWGVFRRRARGPDDPGWKKLVTIAGLADPDPLRNRCRETLLRRDRTAMEGLADSVPIEQVPVRTLVVLGMALSYVGAPDKAISLLRRAQHQYPSDLWLNDALGDLSWGAFRPPHTEDALRFYSIALALRPTRPQLHYVVGLILHYKKDVEGAIREFQAALKLDPKLAIAHISLGDALRTKNLLDPAIAEFRKAIELDPKSAPAHNSLGWALKAKNQLDEAIAEFRKAIDIDPARPNPHNDLGIALKAKNQWDLAVSEFRTAIELDPKLAPVHDNLGIALAAKNQWDEAIAEHKKAIDLDPKFEPAHDNLGVALRAKNQLDEAIAEFRKAIELDPKCASAHMNLGVALRAKNQLDPAVAEFRKAIELDPRLAMAHYNLGGALKAKNQLDEAIAECRKSIDLDPKFVPAHYNLGNALLGKGQLKEAIGEYRKAIELDPKFVPAHYNLGNALRARNQWEATIAEYRKVIELDPGLANAHYDLAGALKAKNQLEEAIAEYRKAIELDPKLALAHFNLGIALLGKNQLDAAVAEFEKTIELDPKGAGAHHNLGVALQAKNQWDEAMSEYRKAIEFDPKGAGAHYALGNALRARSRSEDAIAEYRKVIDLQVDYYAEANCNLAGILQSQGQLSASLDFYKQGHASGSQRKDWRYPSAQWVANAERLVHFEAKLAEVLAGKATATDNRERLGLAEVCRLKGRHVAAARFFADAFAAQAKLADDLKAGHRYNAACCAAMAAAGQGLDADKLDDQEHRRLRQQALAWLRADLEQRVKLSEAGKPEDRQVMRATLERWQRDTDLAGVRDADALQKLTTKEQEAWRKLWADVTESLKKAGDAKS